jgi:hypothetical protein
MKHVSLLPSIARLALTLAVGSLAASVMARPYATSLTNSGTAISFRLNESADNVKIISGGGAVTNDLGPLPKGLTVTNLTITGGNFGPAPYVRMGVPPTRAGCCVVGMVNDEFTMEDALSHHSP